MRWSLALLIGLFLSGAAWAQPQPQAELRILDVAAPAGGMAVAVVELTEPQPISKGQMCLTFSAQLLGNATDWAVFSSGSVSSEVSQSSGTVVIEVDSPDSSFGTASNLPIAVLAFPVLSSAQTGQSAQITLDANTVFFDPQGQPYPQDVQPGVFTVAGYSVSQMTPSSGLAVAGSKIVFEGIDFPPRLRVDIDGAQTGSLQVISPQRAEVTLLDDFTIQPTTRLRFRDRDNRDLPDIYLYPAVFSGLQPMPNSPPVAESDEAETSERTAVAIEVLANDSDPDGDPISLISVTQPAYGKTQIFQQSSVRYTPDRGFQGLDSFAYTIADSQGAQASATVSVNVLPALQTVLTASGGSKSAGLATQVDRVVEFPVAENTAQAPVGLALTNRSQAPALLRVRAFAETSLTPARAAALDFEVSLDPMSQLSQLLSEYDPLLDGFRGWIELSSTNTDVAAMFLNLSRAKGGFAGASASPRANSFAFPQSSVTPEGDFEFTLVNNNARPAEVLLIWQSPATRAQTQLTLAARQSLSRSVLEAFSGLSPQALESGYLLANSSEPLSAFQQRRSEAHLLGQRPPSISSASTLLHLPHLVAGPDWFTELSLINPGDTAAEAVLRLVDDSLAPVSEFAGQDSVTVILQPQEQLIAHLNDLFAMTPSEVRAGSLIIESTAPLVGASVIGRDSPLGPAAILPLLAYPFSSAVFAQAASGELQGIRLFTGLAFQNPQPGPVTVSVQVFSQQGALLGQGEVELLAAQRCSRLLSEIIPDLQSFASGYLVVQSTQPILMLEIFGNQQLDFLSTVDASIQ